MSAIPGRGKSKDGYTRRDCFHAMYVGRGSVACDRKDCESLTGGFFVAAIIALVLAIGGGRSMQ